MWYFTDIFSKISLESRITVRSKISLKEFKKMQAISDFLKAHLVLKEGLLYIGDGLTFLSYAYEEYTNPKSPAYGDESKAIYGGINSFAWDMGPLEGAEYGGPVGAVLGTVNTTGRMGKDIINSIPKIWGDKDGFDWSSSAEDKRKWLNEQYKKHGEYEVIPTDKEYKIGVPVHSGSTNINAQMNNKIYKRN